jgi:RNA polymerase sigma-70 factor, ECF subfamily
MTEVNEFETFMQAYQGMVFTTASRLLGNTAEAEDVSQEVFLKAYERFDQLRTSPTVGGWLKTVTRNLCLNHLSRYRSRWRFFSELFSGEDSGEEMEMNLPAPDTFEADLDLADQRQVLEKALEKLPAAQRVPLVLYHFEDQSYEEIAATLRISLSKVKTDIFRARESLRKKLMTHAGVSGHVDLPSRRPDSETRNRVERQAKGWDLQPNVLASGLS